MDVRHDDRSCPDDRIRLFVVGLTAGRSLAAVVCLRHTLPRRASGRRQVQRQVRPRGVSDDRRPRSRDRRPDVSTAATVDLRRAMGPPGDCMARSRPELRASGTARASDAPGGAGHHAGEVLRVGEARRGNGPGDGRAARRPFVPRRKDSSFRCRANVAKSAARRQAAPGASAAFGC